MPAKLSAEFLGTLSLVLGGCGSAVLAATFPAVGIGLLGVSFAFGLTVLKGAYALGPISGGHFNPAVTMGLWAGGRFPASRVIPYVLAQVAGGIAGCPRKFLLEVAASAEVPRAELKEPVIAFRPSSSTLRASRRRASASFRFERASTSRSRDGRSKGSRRAISKSRVWRASRVGSDPEARAPFASLCSAERCSPSNSSRGALSFVAGRVPRSLGGAGG